MAAGQRILIVRENAEPTAVQGADMSEISRPFPIKLPDAKNIPHRRVGRHRRIRTEYVTACTASIDDERERVLDRLAAGDREQDMGHGKP